MTDHGFEYGTRDSLTPAIPGAVGPGDILIGSGRYTMRIMQGSEVRPNIQLHPDVLTHYLYRRLDGVALFTCVAGPMYGSGVWVIHYDFPRPYDLWASEWSGDKPSTLLYRVQDGPNGAIDVIQGEHL
jgi:hypothetical protein